RSASVSWLAYSLPTRNRSMTPTVCRRRAPAYGPHPRTVPRVHGCANGPARSTGLRPSSDAQAGGRWPLLRVKGGGEGVFGADADERGRRRHGQGVVAGELALALGQGDGSAVPGGEGVVEGDHERGGLRIGYRGDGRDDLPGSLHDEGGAEAQQLIARGDDRPPDVARREHDQLGCPA